MAHFWMQNFTYFWYVFFAGHGAKSCVRVFCASLFCMDFDSLFFTMARKDFWSSFGLSLFLCFSLLHFCIFKFDTSPARNARFWKPVWFLSFAAAILNHRNWIVNCMLKNVFLKPPLALSYFWCLQNTVRRRDLCVFVFFNTHYWSLFFVLQNARNGWWRAFLICTISGPQTT